MDQEFRAIPEGERVIVGGDLNGHGGISREAIERIGNTFFEKRSNYLVTYKSG